MFKKLKWCPLVSPVSGKLASLLYRANEKKFSIGQSSRPFTNLKVCINTSPHKCLCANDGNFNSFNLVSYGNLSLSNLTATLWLAFEHVQYYQ